MKTNTGHKIINCTCVFILIKWYTFTLCWSRFCMYFFNQIKSTLFSYDSFFLVSKQYKLNTWTPVNIIIIEMIHNVMNWNYTAPVLVNVITVVNWLTSSNDNEAKILNQKVINVYEKPYTKTFAYKTNCCKQHRVYIRFLYFLSAWKGAQNINIPLLFRRQRNFSEETFGGILNSRWKDRDTLMPSSSRQWSALTMTSGPQRCTLIWSGVKVDRSISCLKHEDVSSAVSSSVSSIAISSPSFWLLARKGASTTSWWPWL